MLLYTPELTHASIPKVEPSRPGSIVASSAERGTILITWWRVGSPILSFRQTAKVLGLAGLLSGMEMLLL